MQRVRRKPSGCPEAHADGAPRLTQNIYTHLLLADLRSGKDKLPDYKLTVEEKQKVTVGTAIALQIRDTPIDTKSAHKDEFQRTSDDDKAGFAGSVSKLKTPFAILKTRF